MRVQRFSPDTKHWVMIESDTGAVFGSRSVQFIGVPVMEGEIEEPVLAEPVRRVADPLADFR